MISFWAEKDRKCLSIKGPLAFFVNLFKKKKYKAKKNNVRQNGKSGKAPKVPNSLSVSVMDMRMNSPCPVSPALSVLTLTPGRTRDIDQDMEALRLSRQDNPFLQVLASRESLVESIFETESDDTNLMSQEFPNDLEIDPLSLPEIHEHMIRSPPPTTWPKSPNYKIFRFPVPSSQESLHVNCNQTGSIIKCASKVNSPISVTDPDKEILKESKNNESSDIYLGNYSFQSSSQSSHNWSHSEFRDSLSSVFHAF